MDTPVDASIGERFFAVRDLIDDDLFLANYGDTVTDVPLPALIDAHRASGKTASLLAVPPNYTFNVVTTNGSSLVSSFDDIGESGIRINGGYFVFRREVFDYIEQGEDLPEMFRRLIAADGSSRTPTTASGRRWTRSKTRRPSKSWCRTAAACGRYGSARRGLGRLSAPC